MTMATETLEASRKLAESLSSTLSDEERPGYVKAAGYVVEGLRIICAEANGPEEVAVRMAHVITRMLAEIQRSALMEASDFCEQNMIAYALAAGNMAGVFDLPDSEDSGPSERLPAPELAEAWRNRDKEQIGQYL